MSDRAKDLKAIRGRVEASSLTTSQIVGIDVDDIAGEMEGDGWHMSAATLFANAPTDIAVLLRMVEELSAHIRGEHSAIAARLTTDELIDHLWAEAKEGVGRG